MKLLRTLRHLSASGWSLRRTFNAAALEAIEGAIAETERTHGGEIRFAVEGALGAEALWRDVSPRERAIEVFARSGVWDTEVNNGVLIYVLWADRDVEIVADRGFNGKVSAEEWLSVCHRMETLFAGGQAHQAAVEGVQAVGALIARHYPAMDRNELPDRALVI
jgi:hypothetical protein